MIAGRHPRARAIAVAAICAGAAWLPSCRDTTPPIVVEDRMVKVYNGTAKPLTDVRVWLNDHFMAAGPTLQPGGRLVVPQRDFATAFGQRFDPSRHAAFGVLVTAKAGEEDVRLVWGRPNRK
jgi:hypothetical protein